MMKRSAGILPYKIVDGKLYVYLEHPGGPFWRGRDTWSICKGEYDGEKAIDAAIREFYEEAGVRVSKNELFFIRSVRQASYKLITIFGVCMDIDPNLMKSNTFKMEYPFGSGQIKEFPEMDKAEWFLVEDAIRKVFKGQIPILQKLNTMFLEHLL